MSDEFYSVVYSSLMTRLCLIGLDDLAAGRPPDVLVTIDVGQGFVEVFDSVGHTGEIWVERDAHDSAAVRAFGVERVELIGDHLRKVASWHTQPLEHTLVVELHGVRN